MIPNGDSSFNEWADFWRCECGLNVIPANSKKKETYEKWSQWQNEGISEEQHTKWKKHNSFSNGMAIMSGKVWHKEELKDYYLCFVDLDNEKAKEEVCNNVFGVKSIEELAQKTVVEQHLDNKSKAHVYFYTKDVLKKKSSDATKLKDKIDSNEIPAIEVKSLGEHGIAMCTPSVHEKGCNYEIIGTTKLGEFNGKEIEDNLYKIYEKYGLLIGSSKDRDVSKIPIEELFEPGFIIKEGHNRSEAVMRVFESLYARYGNTKSFETIRQETYNWMTEHCDPPLDLDKFERQLKDGRNFVDRTATQNQESVLQQQLKIKDGENTTFMIVDYSIPYKAYYMDEKLGQICYGRLKEDGIFPLKSIIILYRRN